MKIIILSFVMIALLQTYQQPVFAQTNYTALAAKQTRSLSLNTMPATILQFSGTINSKRILLNWTIDKNQGVDQIEVERSKDGKNFDMAGLVFGTDQADKVDYFFYEKNKKTKSFYRLKIINKDRTSIYSSIISPEPAPTTH